MSNAASYQREHSRRKRSRPFRAVLAFLLRIQQRWQQRRHLEELDDHLLADIGLKPADVRRALTSHFPTNGRADISITDEQ